MAANPTSPPSPQESLALHRRLLEGDPVAPSDLAVAYLDSLAAWLIRRHPHLDESLCQTAAEDAIISLIKNPGSFQPGRGSLDAYLRMSAGGDLKNLLRAERRHGDHQASWEAVELSSEAGKYLQDEDADPAAVVERREALAESLAERRIPASVLARLSPPEVTVLQLMTIKERQTAVYARALGLEELPELEQRRQVKRIKDRVQKKIERGGYG